MSVSAYIALALAATVSVSVSAPAPARERAPLEPQAVQWPAADEAPDGPGEGADPREADPDARDRGAKTKSAVPSPRAAGARPPIEVAVGLDPSAPGSKSEKALVDQLEAAVPQSSDPPAKVRRLRAGSPSGREVCRAGRDELVILVGYVPTREEPVLLVHDCRLDKALDLRGEAAASSAGLVGSLWDEHDALIRDGVRERRRLKGLSPVARAGIIGGVALVLIGVAVGVLVASALRDEKVVIKVSP